MIGEKGKRFEFSEAVNFRNIQNMLQRKEYVMMVYIKLSNTGHKLAVLVSMFGGR